MQTLVAKQAWCNLLGPHPCNDINEDVTPLQFDDATGQEVVKPK